MLILVYTMTLLLAACGGGDSSSDSSAGTRFTGLQTIVVLGNASQAAFVMTVSGTTVTINDDDFTASGTLNGNNFTVTVPNFTATVDGITCTFTNLTYTGSISGTTASGNLSGSAVCSGITLSITGTFSANSGSGKQVINTFSQAVVELAK